MKAAAFVLTVGLLAAGPALGQGETAASSTVAAPRPASAPTDAGAVVDAAQPTEVAPVVDSVPDSGPAPVVADAAPRPVPRPAPRVRRRPPRIRRSTAKAPPPDAGEVPEDAGVAAVSPPPAGPVAPTKPAPSSGWTFFDVGPPRPSAEGPSAFDRIVERLDAALWPVVQVGLLIFVFLRILSWWVRRRARQGQPTYVLLRRGWVFVEGSVWVLATTWALFELSARQSPSATLLAIIAFAVLVALSWNGLRDVASGLMLAAERPFGLGDHVTLEDGEGRVRAFRSRVLELESPDGLRIRVPYRRVLGAARIRKGGRQTAHAVELELDVPEAMEPQDALRTLAELAASSPWAVIGERPRLELLGAGAQARVRVVAFAFDGEAEPLLFADLLSGWRDASRRSTEGRGAR